jgi:hypothetical protein
MIYRTCFSGFLHYGSALENTCATTANTGRERRLESEAIQTRSKQTVAAQQQRSPTTIRGAGVAERL